jgi:NAD(P)-dependent dehydrogenase (short-subunit alcohol dehydrogenase family)
MKKVVVIGGSSGIGLELVKNLAEQNAEVIATYNNTAPSFSHPNVTYHPFDVLKEESDLHFLPETVDGLVYCPGKIDLKPFARIKLQDFRDDLELQVLGAVKIIQASLPKLKKSNLASIVLFSTVAVQNGFNFHSQVALSKGAIEGLTRSLSAELAPNIRVNCIAPSLTDTPLASRLLSSEEKKQANADRHPLKKIGQPTDIAEMAAFLLSQKASWITGQIIGVDGGMSSIKN